MSENTSSSGPSSLESYSASSSEPTGGDHTHGTKHHKHGAQHHAHGTHHHTHGAHDHTHGAHHHAHDRKGSSVSNDIPKHEILEGHAGPSLEYSITEASFSNETSFARENEERGTWRGDNDFLMASVGSLVGLGNIWRFPVLVYKNGGGAFLVPYFICVIIGGIPLIYLEVAIGQFMNKEGSQAWNLVPLFQGIAMTQFVVLFYTCCYYNVIIAWAFYYLINSFAWELPWQHCQNEWNTPNCSDAGHEAHGRNYTSPVEEFWELQLLGISHGIEEIGEVKWDLAFCLLFSWFIIYCCVCKGILTTGRIMHVTTTLAYLLMLILLVRHSLLSGAVDGIKYFISPDFSRLADYRVWKDAGEQVFISSSIGFGCLTVLGSYNKFNHNSFRDSVIMSSADTGTSLLFGLLVFTVLGFMAHLQDVTVADVTVAGPGLTFIAIPTAVNQMPMASLWSVLFFLMISIVGLDTQFVLVEALVTEFLQQYPHLLHNHKRDFFTSLACGFFCAVGLLMVTKGGMYVFLLFDHYASGPVLLLVGFSELVAISYVYGIRRFCDNIQMMRGKSQMKYTLHYLVVCWTVLSPIFCMTMFVMVFADYSDLTYDHPNRPQYHFPQWTKPLGWCIAGSSIIWIPLVMLYKFLKSGASIKAMKLQTVPYYLHAHQKRPQDENEECLHDHEPKAQVSNTEEVRKISGLSGALAPE